MLNRACLICVMFIELLVDISLSLMRINCSAGRLNGLKWWLICSKRSCVASSVSLLFKRLSEPSSEQKVNLRGSRAIALSNVLEAFKDGETLVCVTCCSAAHCTALLVKLFLMSSLKLRSCNLPPWIHYFGGVRDDELTFRCHFNVVCITAASLRVPTELVGIMLCYRRQC